MSASHLILTGQPGVGKTTIIRKVCEELKKKQLKVDGFYTEEVRVGRERIGFDIVTLSGQRDVLARVSDAGTARGLPKVGKYSVHVPSFEKLSLPVFECSGLDVLVLDEIGKMELFSRAFLSRARQAFQERSGARRILATIPLPKGSLPLVDELRHRDDCKIIQIIMLYIPSWIFIVLMSSKLCSCTLSDLGHHLLHATNVSSDMLQAWMPDASGSDHSYHSIQSQSGFPPEVESLLANYHAGMRHAPGQQQRFSPYHHSLDYRRPDYRTSAYNDHQAAHSEVEYDVAPLRKHEFTDGGQGYGGWDMLSGGSNHGSGGLAQVGQIVKKGKEAKALFALMAPLILLAVFGPILATQAMVPWVTGGGLGTITAVAQGRRKKRSFPGPELEKRLKLFLEVQDYIARSGSSARLAQEMGEAFLRCQKFTERRSKCLERVACEYSDETSPMDPAERRLAKMVLQNVASNPMIPTPIKGRLSKGSAFGRNNRGRCKNYWCEAIDGSREKPRT